MATTEIAQAAAMFRAKLAERDAEAMSRMLDAYSGIYERLRPQIEAALATAGDGTPDERFERARLGEILSQLNTELEIAAAGAGELLTERQAESVSLAQSHARELGNIAMGEIPTGFTGPTWAHVPDEQLKEIVGILGDGSPVESILREIAPDGVERVRAAIVHGLGSGLTPRQIARGVRDALGSNMARVMTVIRTEDMRAYRGSTHQFFEENSDVVVGWTWMASLSFDTCAACLAMHGTKHTLDETLDAHPNCRCVALPDVERDDGSQAPRTGSEMETGEEWLERQTEENQRRTLGPSKYEAWKSGQIKLSDLKVHSHNDTWGGMYHEASLKAALENAAARGGTPKPKKPAPKPIPPVAPVPAPKPAPTPALVKSLPPKAPDAIPDFKKIPEVETWLTEKGFENVSLKGMNVEVAGAVAKALDEAKRDFPDLKLDAIKTVRRVKKGQPSFVMQNVASGPAYGTVENTLEINLAFFMKTTPLEDINAEIAQAAKARWWVPNDVRGIVYHEMGHTLTYQGLTMLDAAARQRELTPIIFDKKTLSTYSAANGREGIAESFAHYARYGHLKGVKIATGSKLSAREFVKKYTGIDMPD